MRSQHPDLQDSAALLGAAVSYLRGSEDPITSLKPYGLADHLGRLGPRPPSSGAAANVLLRTVEAAELTGRGGGHFPVAAKWRTQLRAGGGGVVVANGAESEPASVKDQALMQLRPHLLLDGLACVAELVDAEDVVIWLHEATQRTEQMLREAMLERRQAGHDDPQIRIVTGPARYLSGESSAIVNALDTAIALPRFSTVPAAQAGVGGNPTLIHNIETLCRVALLARSSTSYRPTTLLSVSHGDSRTAIELDPAAALDDVIATLTGLTHSALPQALLIGGYGGTWRTWDEITRSGATVAALRANGVSLGAGVVIPVVAGECGLRQASLIADYLADNSARQCGPCLFGLPTVAALLAELVDGHARRRDVSRLEKFLDEIAGRGACHHPDGAVRMISSALVTFAEDVDAHLRTGRCMHADCKPFANIAAVSL